MKKSSVQLILIISVMIALTGIYSCKSSKKMAGATKTTAEKTDTTAVKKPTAEETATKPKTEKTSASATEKLENYFNAIASSPTVQTANANISEALTMFSSGDVPVIISFYRENGVKDYDEPTTILKYLNYLKDQKKNPNKVEEIITGDDGKIVELDLIKR